MAFLEDPRLRQRWNQITHDAETVTENAAAGIWSFQQHYLNPCFGYLGDSFDQCTSLCLGDVEERRRRRRERERSTPGAEYAFDFYEDWYDEQTLDDGGGGGSGFFGNWAGEDWDRLLAGTGSQRKHLGGEGTTTTTEQPRRKRGMSYGTRGTRRKASEHDPTIIPSTQPIGFLSKLPWKMGGTLRYKPSAADLQDNPGKHEDPETEPLLPAANNDEEESDYGQLLVPRKRSGTTGSGGTGGTSDSYRSRGDLFPSDGEGEEDAIVLDDDVTYDMVRNDRSSGKSDGTRSSKGKRPIDGEGYFATRTLSRTTIASNSSADTMPRRRSLSSHVASPATEHVPSLHDLRLDEERIQQEEDEEVARKKEAAVQLAARLGLPPNNNADSYSIAELKTVSSSDDVHTIQPAPQIFQQQQQGTTSNGRTTQEAQAKPSRRASHTSQDAFIPARLPYFGS